MKRNIQMLFVEKNKLSNLNKEKKLNNATIKNFENGIGKKNFGEMEVYYDDSQNLRVAK